MGLAFGGCWVGLEPHDWSTDIGQVHHFHHAGRGLHKHVQVAAGQGTRRVEELAHGQLVLRKGRGGQERW